MIVHNHLLTAANQGASDFDRRQPIDMKVGQGVVGKTDCGIHHTFLFPALPRDWSSPNRRNIDRFFIQEIGHDREIMRGQIP